MASMAGLSKKPPQDETDNNDYLSGPSFSLLSSEDHEVTSTLQYVNSQLVAHGFARSPGLTLDGMGKADSERLVKCLLAMLSQRIEDLQRTEELGTKLRTLTYEHERLQSMHRVEVDTSANAEREMNLFKSKMAASQRSLTLEVTAHKQTLSELQRTRTSLQYLRSTTQNELKRKDKEVERVLDRWNKVSDAQIKLTGAQSGLYCPNLVVGGEEYVKGKGLMEEALEHAEEARRELVKENEGFRSVILGTANALQNMVYNVKGLSVDVHVEEPAPLTHTAVFAPPTSSLLHADNAHIKLRGLMAAIREAISGISTLSSSSSARAIETKEEVNKLKDLVQSLRDELSQARQSSDTLATQAQEVLDRFTTQASERLMDGRDPTPEEAAEMSMELMGVLERDELRETLQKREAELQAERARFTEAAVKLGKDKAALEVERLRLLEEKRRWAVDQMLAELPPTPGPDPDLVSPPQPSKTTVKQPSPSPPRVRPRKVGGSKGGLKSPSKQTALATRIPGGIALVKSESSKSTRKGNEVLRVDVLDDSEVPQVRATGATENELQRSTTPEDWPPATPAAAAVATGMKASLPLVLPTTFTLPPPSPASSLSPLDLGTISPSASIAPAPTSFSTVPSFDAIPLATSVHPPIVPLVRPRIFHSPRTPRPIIGAPKKHAYSPARPSPLSRILMIADSPPSPLSVSTVQEDEENKAATPLESPTDAATSALPQRFLAQERWDAPINAPGSLRERRGANLNGSVAADTRVTGSSVENTMTNHDQKTYTAKEKGKGRAAPSINEFTAMDKENVTSAPKVTRPGKARVTFHSNGGFEAASVRSSKLAGAETRNQIVTVKGNLKPTSTNVRNGPSSGPVRGSGGAFQSSARMTGVGTIKARAGGARASAGK